ncbi:FAD-dependent monooxygenase [Streptomyces olivoreticuli]
MDGKGPRIAVVGAGLGGLAAAAAMRRRGLDVTVYERADRLREDGVGMHLGPNGTRLLRRLGLDGFLAEHAVRPEALEVRAFTDGRVLTRQEMGAAWEEEFGAPYLTAHRGELHRALAGLLPDEVVRTGKELVAHEETADGVRLEFADGDVAHADVLIGADGVHSLVRRSVAGGENPVFSGNSAFRGLVDADAVPALSPDLMYMFAGPAARLLCYPVSGGRQFTYVAVVPDPDWTEESWTSAGRREDLAAALAGWTPEALSVAAGAGEVRRWALYDREPLEHWSTARTTLLGDAAHPMLPHHGQGANQAFEDGMALALCLAEAEPGRAGVAAALRRYEDSRRPHTAKVQLGSRDSGSLRLGGGRPQQGGAPGAAGSAGDSGTPGALSRMVQDVGWIQRHDAEAALAAGPGTRAAATGGDIGG